MEKIKDKIDFFGTHPHLFFQNKKVYRSNQGVFFTLLFGICILVALWVYGKELIYRENPKTTYTETYNKHPSRYNITKDQFNFAFGFQDKDYQSFYDPSIMTIDIYQNIIRSKKLANGTTISTFEKYDLGPKPCEKSDFTVDTEYFHSIYGLSNYICISNYSDVFIEGDFGMEVFAEVKGSVKPCTNNTDSNIICKPQKTIDDTLADVYYAFFLTDEVVNPQDFDNPYRKAGRNLYGFASSKAFYHVDLYYKNVFLHDNTGIFYDNHSTKQGLSFANEKVFTKNKEMETKEFIKFNIRFEKVKETRIYRTYLNFAEVAAYIGGILKVLMIFFATISGYISLNEYNLELANDVFKFNFDSNNSTNKKNNKNENNIQSHFLKFKSIFGQFFSFGQNNNEQSKKKLFHIAQNKLKQKLNIQNILKTLTDVEKLKILLLDDNQQYLFDYLPKPEISEKHLREIENTNRMRMSLKQVQSINQKTMRQNKKKTSNIAVSGQQEFTVSLNDLKQGSMQRNRQRANTIKFNNILLMEQQSDQIKKQMAFKAFKQIKEKQELSPLDEKLMKLTDKQIIDELAQEFQADFSHNPNNNHNNTTANNNTNNNTLAIPIQRSQTQNFLSNNSLFSQQDPPTSDPKLPSFQKCDKKQIYNTQGEEIRKSIQSKSKNQLDFSFQMEEQERQRQIRSLQQFQQSEQNSFSMFSNARGSLRQENQHEIYDNFNETKRDKKNTYSTESLGELSMNEDSITNNVDDFVIESKREQDSTIRQFFNSSNNNNTQRGFNQKC